MPYGEPDFWDWLKLGGSLAGAAGSAGAFGGAPGSIVPTGDTLSGLSGAQMNLQGINSATPTGAPAWQAPNMDASPFNTAGPPPPEIASAVDGATTPKANLGLPQTTPLTADAVNATTASSPPPGATTPVVGTGGTPYPFKYADKPIGTENTRTWWERNVSDPWDKANTVDPKTGISPAQKALSGFGQQAITAASKGPEAPKFAAAGGSVYKPSTAFNAAQMALSREQQLELLRRRATLNAPWLRRGAQPSAGLMG